MTLETIFFVFMAGPTSPFPPEVAEEVRLAFRRWEAHESFLTQEVGIELSTPSTIQIHWQPIDSPNAVGRAWCVCFGHEQNRIILNSDFDWEGERDTLLFEVAMHEIGHIVLGARHIYGDPTALMSPSTFYRRMGPNFEEQFGSPWGEHGWTGGSLLVVYGVVRPIPNEPVGGWRP